MAEAPRCKTCGRTLESRGADCPVCLLNLALETSSDGDERSTPPQSEDGRRHRLQPGSRVGPYEIVRELGEGGMGIVYLADQARPIKRRVALKVIKHGMDTDQVVKRFEAERQALALMDHVAIARVHEAGETATGRPYFAMEYIEGEPITAYCDRHRLDTAQRLALFSKVCDGLQHAHQRGIIHRDIKPSNVLVTEAEGEASPKIIDFGVAKATEQSLTEHSALTALGVLLGTPEYMSPEQAELAPLHVDTRTDVYSLGVVLYELLTGALPFDHRAVRAAAFDEVRRQIREVRPSKPSTRVSDLGEKASGSALSRRADVSSLCRRLTGDLDLITMKALEKDRDRRYGSPAELADDINRHLAREPVLARPPSAMYQLSKLISRHKLPAALIFGFVLVLIGFSIWMSLLYRNSQVNLDRAVRAEAEAARVSDFLVGVFEVSEPSEARGNTATARELLDSAADKIEKELSDQPEVQATLMHTMGRVYHSLGLLDRSAELLDEAVRRRESLLGAEDPAVAESLASLARTKLALGEFENSEQLARRALGIIEGRADADTAAMAPLEVLQSNYWQLRDHDRAMPIALQLVETAERVYGEKSEETADARRSLAILYMAMDRIDAAEALFEQVIELEEGLYDGEHPTLVETKLNLAELYRYEGRYEEAEAMFLEIQELESRLYEENHPQRAFAFNNLGLVYNRQNRTDEAIEQYATAIAIREASLPENHPLLAWTLDNLGLVYMRAGRLDEASATIERALAIAIEAVGPDNADTGIVNANLALVRLEQKRYDEAEALFRRTLEINMKVFGRNHGETANTFHNLGDLMSEMERYDQAEKMFRDSIEINAAIHGDDHIDVADTKNNLAVVLEKTGRLDEAVALYREALKVFEATLGPDHRDTTKLRGRLDELLAGND